MEMITITDSKKFNEFLKTSQTPVIVDFSASWCGPCKILTPILEKMSDNIKNVSFVKIDVEKVSDLSEKYNITGVPTLIFFKNELEVKRIVGAVSENKLQSVIDETLNM